MATDHPNPSKPRRRWFQYSLRSLFVLVTVLAKISPRRTAPFPAR